MDKRPLFFAAFILLFALISFPPVLKFFSRPVLVAGFPLILVFITAVALAALILWIIFYYAFYRKS